MSDTTTPNEATAELNKILERQDTDAKASKSGKYFDATREARELASEKYNQEGKK